MSLDHPLGSITWQQPTAKQMLQRSTCMVADFHMCAFDKMTLSGDGYFRKPTRMLTNAPRMGASVLEATDMCPSKGASWGSTAASMRRSTRTASAAL